MNELVGYAIGAAILTALTSDASLIASLGFHTGLSVVLVPLLQRSVPGSIGSIGLRYGVVVAVFVGGIVLLSTWYSSVLVVSAIVFASIVLCGYGLHRYERVRLGLAGGEENA
ncbi:hypothetical protein [Haloprofundus salilacus]|uniref:hypothetical protein n=1 Tax=Haloprofundus salilacus TaxID=2876190 RepID=UPI001CCC4C46|nr:hypothetical protein [Haloprofundus salilacus]